VRVRALTYVREWCRFQAARGVLEVKTRRVAAPFRFLVLAAGLAFLLIPAAQARSGGAGDIVGTWTNAGGGITITVVPRGSDFVGELTTATKGCTSIGSIGVPAWNITLPSPAGGTYSGTSMQNIGTDSSGKCWAEGVSEMAAWNVSIDGSRLTLVIGETSSIWTKAQATTTRAAADKAIRNAVSKGFTAISAANKKLNACNNTRNSNRLGICRPVAYGLLRVVHHWQTCFRRCSVTNRGTPTVEAGRRAALKSLQYWAQVATAAANSFAAAQSGNVAQQQRWYRVYAAKFKLAESYKKRAWTLLWPR